MSETPSKILQEHFKPIQCSSLLEHWRKRAAGLMDRDGTDPDFENGGHDVKGDPLLQQAIREIRDGYFVLYKHKAELVKEQAKLAKQKKLNPNNAELDISLADLDVSLGDADYDLILWNNKCYERLISPNYGCDIGQQVDPKDGLAKKDAFRIVGTIIGRSLDAFENACGREGWRRVQVPHLPVNKTPQAIQKTRSEEAPDWVERLGDHTRESGGPVV
ncbi:MAG: hypothetical protein J0M34_00690 [Alphaproteobacteria bacterium]|nr:hypothetical protein [Alphaproteobacteria bacterium]